MAADDLDGEATPKFEIPKTSLTVIASCISVGLAIVILQASQIGEWERFVAQAAIMLSVSGASMMLGGLVGFLFGIPRRLQNEGNVKNPRPKTAARNRVNGCFTREIQT
jgi:hypothetical protein